MLLRGLKIFIQNVYLYETTLISVFTQWETWILIHAFIPMTVRLFTKNWRDAMLICYFWETFEATAGLISEQLTGSSILKYLSDYLGKELASDSLILDILQGFVGIMWCEYILQKYELSNGELWSESTKKQKWCYLIIIVVVSLSALMTTIQMQVDITKDLYYYTFIEIIENAFNVIPIGLYPWLVTQLILLWLLENIILGHTSYPSKVTNVFNDIKIYLVYHTIVTIPFIFPVLLTYWLSTPLLILLFKFK